MVIRSDEDLREGLPPLLVPLSLPFVAGATQASFALCQQLSCLGTFMCAVPFFWKLFPTLCLANSYSSIRYQFNVTASKKPSPIACSDFPPSLPGYMVSLTLFPS